ncbi:uncharacterized protein [Petaurus breviceps papuanus]|uniref:uncharacterized protein n=1 Tax=Petaurus breviceps papuanus TaxID=3040969 RepID=UPI0036D9CAEE
MNVQCAGGGGGGERDGVHVTAAANGGDPCESLPVPAGDGSPFQWHLNPGRSSIKVTRSRPPGSGSGSGCGSGKGWSPALGPGPGGAGAREKAVTVAAAAAGGSRSTPPEELPGKWGSGMDPRGPARRRTTWGSAGSVLALSRTAELGISLHRTGRPTAGLFAWDLSAAGRLIKLLWLGLKGLLLLSSLECGCFKQRCRNK